MSKMNRAIIRLAHQIGMHEMQLIEISKIIHSLYFQSNDESMKKELQNLEEWIDRLQDGIQPDTLLEDFIDDE